MADKRWWDSSSPAFVIDAALHVLDEFTHHPAELGVLRDLYPHRPVSG
ncbi:hypothetical protein [Nonomuraea dietziae]